MFAVMFGRNEIVEYLLNKGADKNVLDNRGQSALDISIIQGNSVAAELLSQ